MSSADFVRESLENLRSSDDVDSVNIYAQEALEAGAHPADIRDYAICGYRQALADNLRMARDAVDMAVMSFEDDNPALEALYTEEEEFELYDAEFLNHAEYHADAEAFSKRKSKIVSEDVQAFNSYAEELAWYRQSAMRLLTIMVPDTTNPIHRKFTDKFDALSRKLTEYRPN